MISVSSSILDEENLTLQPLSLKWKWVRGLFVAASCLPWLFLGLAWYVTRVPTEFNIVHILCWLLIVPMSFLLGLTASIFLRLEMRSAGPKRFWWFAMSLAV